MRYNDMERGLDRSDQLVSHLNLFVVSIQVLIVT